MGAVRLVGVRKLFGTIEVIKGVDLTVAEGELMVFVGPSGCGKSTLLRMIAGLEAVDYGTMKIEGRDVTEAAPALRGVAMMFQNHALYPHMTACDNLAYGLRRANIARAEVDRRLLETAALLQISELVPRKPRAMSVGQRQRVAIGRAIVRKPEVLLFDGPLSNLDAALRVEMRGQIARLHQELQAKMIFVTHDQVEAMTLADRIVVLNAGRMEQIGTPREVYHSFANLFVAGFIGSPAMNLLPASLGQGGITLNAGPVLGGPTGQGEAVTWRPAGQAAGRSQTGPRDRTRHADRTSGRRDGSAPAARNRPEADDEAARRCPDPAGRCGRRAVRNCGRGPVRGRRPRTVIRTAPGQGLSCPCLSWGMSV